MILIARRKDRLEKLRSQLIKEHKIFVETFAVNVADCKAVQKVADQFQSKSVDVLINNAGLAKGIDPVHQADVQHWEEMIDTNVKGFTLPHALSFA